MPFLFIVTVKTLKFILLGQSSGLEKISLGFSSSSEIKKKTFLFYYNLFLKMILVKHNYSSLQETSGCTPCRATK